MKKIYKLTLIITATLFVCSCSKNKNVVQDSPSVALAQTQEEPSSQEAETPEESLQEDSLQQRTSHKDFLNDPMTFARYPDGGIKSGETAVVASKVCMLYPESAFNIKADNKASIKDEKAMGGTSVPFASIVSITGPALYNITGNYSGMFLFQDEYNFFYPAEYNGQKGYIFGADLYGAYYGIIKDAEKNKITAELYRTNGALQDFYPSAGYMPLSKSITDSLQKNRLAIQQTKPITNPSPDDMILLYQDLQYNAAQPSIFITTDLASHAQHLIFDRMLQYTEETFFAPRLLTLTNDFIQALNSAEGISQETKQQAVDYFMVPKALLELAPEKKETGDWQVTTSYIEKDTEQVLSSYSERVKKELNQILNASGGTSVIFGTTEDFTQYKPRGHYTKNGILQKYFLAQMWYGRIHFLIAKSEVDPQTEKASLAMMKPALFIIDTVQKNPDLLKKWEEVFNPITTLIGLCDDLSFTELLPLWKEQNVTDLNSWIENKNNLIAFMELCHQKLRTPAISGNSVFYGPSEGSDPINRKPPMGWRFLGQRFTYDSSIHHQLSSPRLYKRTHVSGLDIAKVFGSKTAESLLTSEYANMESEGVPFKARINEIKKEFDSYPESFWNQTYYNQVLNQVRTQARFDQGSGFYFTEGSLWGIKSLMAALGTWAELRHDTILYVKQSYAELGGGDDLSPTYRTEELPRPINYIEPNVPFWECSLKAAEGLENALKKYNMLDEDSKDALASLKDIYSKCLEIAKKEVLNQSITKNENAWIKTIPNLFANLVFVHQAKSGAMLYSEDTDQYKMACIADVFTNAESFFCLETGVGVPYRLYVPLNDSQGGKRIAVGYSFSYYEFEQDMNKRLTDEEWKKTVYASSSDMTKYMPSWEKSCFIASDGTFEH